MGKVVLIWFLIEKYGYFDLYITQGQVTQIARKHETLVELHWVTRMWPCQEPIP